MLDKLEDAIYAKFVNTSALTTAFPSRTDNGLVVPVGFYWDLAFEGTPLPYVVATEIASPTTLKYGGIHRSDAEIQFAVYAIGGRSAVRALMATVNSVFDDLILTLSTGHMTNTVRTSEPLTAFDGLDGQNRKVYQSVATYRFTITP